MFIFIISVYFYLHISLAFFLYLPDIFKWFPCEIFSALLASMPNLERTQLFANISFCLAGIFFLTLIYNFFGSMTFSLLFTESLIYIVHYGTRSNSNSHEVFLAKCLNSKSFHYVSFSYLHFHELTFHKHLTFLKVSHFNYIYIRVNRRHIHFHVI